MATPAIPDDPFALFEHPPFEVQTRAWRDVFGVPAEVISLPARAALHGVPGPERPAFQTSRADAIYLFYLPTLIKPAPTMLQQKVVNISGAS